MKDKTARY